MRKNILGNYLRNLREQHGLKQPVLAEQLEISTAFINFIELGKRMPSKATLNKFSDFFKVDTDHLEDLLQKQRLLNKETSDEEKTEEVPEPIQKLTILLQKVDKPLLEELVTSFMEQVNNHLVKMTANYSISDLRDTFKKKLDFENEQMDEICVEGFLKMPEDHQLFFKFTRLEKSISLELLQNDRSKIEMFEKWIGPHVFSNLCDVSIPQVMEAQRGVSFTWFSPSLALAEQHNYLLRQNELDLERVLFNSGQLAWHIQTQSEMVE